MSAVKLDGRTLEGGGQLLRNAICLSALTGTPVEIDNIRGNRSSGGGLKAQHLACVNWLAVACNAKVTGGEKGSKALIFAPEMQEGSKSPAYKQLDDPYHFESTVDIGTAGSTGLVLQAVLPYILFAPPRTATHIRLRVSGGTNVSGSPSYEYLTQVLLPILETIGLPAITASLQARGWSTGRSTPGSFVLDIPISHTRPLPAFALRPSDKSKKPTKPTRLQVTFLGPHSCHEHLRLVLVPAIQHYFGLAYKPGTSNLSVNCEDSGDDKRLYLIIMAIVAAPEDKIKEYRLARDWLYDRKKHTAAYAAECTLIVCRPPKFPAQRALSLRHYRLCTPLRLSTQQHHHLDRD
ncbi:hypothetical protein AMS68_000282 [Peltaster fructicola]|uniref:RNA 3'-terminal phosphate cyclase domain-containing protein n=1 Tax=Peltaster fructicola TaxID=286661 RepID=A0A6H0XJG0_9PEZI|nr:hypothetical protein AMS68_000282 [Peltaster fructicola]